MRSLSTALASLVDIKQWSEIPATQPLFETLMAFWNYPIEATLGTRSQHLGLRGMQIVERGSYPLALAATLGKQLQFCFAYDTRRCDAKTVERAADHLEHILNAMICNIEQQIDAVNLLGVKEQEQVLLQGTGEHQEISGKCFHEMFSAQAGREPEATAVRCGAQQLSYQELEQQANRLAHYLQKSGVGPEVRVGVCTERSVEMMVAVLAVLKKPEALFCP